MAVLGVSCLSGKEVQGEIPEEIAQLWLWCQDLAGSSQLLGALGGWLLQELVRLCPATQKEPACALGAPGPLGLVSQE